MIFTTKKIRRMREFYRYPPPFAPPKHLTKNENEEGIQLIRVEIWIG